jgi:valyl-tRNA synthetase
MKQDLDKIYNPGENEDQIYEKWEKSGYFNPDNLNLFAKAPNYTIVLPPPNITDKLHMGHAATVAIEDLLIRYHRLSGFRTLWLPGTDHAAIATQNVVEKKLWREQNKTRHDLGREKFLEEVWAFLKVTQGKILHQTRKLGASLDWSRIAFTLDEPRRLAVRTMFKEMYDEGIIYRGERIVNWCPRCHSTLADDEVEYQEQSAKLYTFQYDKDFPIAISTTRPETKLGDTAVAVNPKDERYKKYIGREFDVDFCGQKLKIKIIADRNVEASFGTGALGVTPAHSLIDEQMARENDLPIIKVINEDGLIHSGFGQYSGLSVAAAREKIVAELIKRGLLKKEEDINNNLSVCYRCATPIEPLPSRQWFISVDKKLKRLGNLSLKERALEAVRTDDLKIIPARFTKRYSDWMSNLHDWCISRQIWFGHQIPVWYQGEKIFVGSEAPDGAGWTQDPDTLDTWFSSGMWTFSTLGWPENYKNGRKSGDLSKFHPTQMLETGYEILTLWVSRMVMMSFFALGEVPFEKVYLHGMVLDENGGPFGYYRQVRCRCGATFPFDGRHSRKRFSVQRRTGGGEKEFYQ